MCSFQFVWCWLDPVWGLAVLCGLGVVNVDQPQSLMLLGTGALPTKHNASVASRIVLHETWFVVKRVEIHPNQSVSSHPMCLLHCLALCQLAGSAKQSQAEIRLRRSCKAKYVFFWCFLGYTIYDGIWYISYIRMNCTMFKPYQSVPATLRLNFFLPRSRQISCRGGFAKPSCTYCCDGHCDLPIWGCKAFTCQSTCCSWLRWPRQLSLTSTFGMIRSTTRTSFARYHLYDLPSFYQVIETWEKLGKTSRAVPFLRRMSWVYDDIIWWYICVWILIIFV